MVFAQSLSRVLLFATPWTAARGLPCPSLSSGVCSNSCPLMLPNQLIFYCPLTLLPLVFRSIRVFFFSPMCQLFASVGQGIRASASASVLPMNIQGWFPFGLTDLIFLLPKGLSRVFSSIAVRKHSFFGAQLSLSYISHIHTRLLEKPKLWLYGPLSAK